MGYRVSADGGQSDRPSRGWALAMLVPVVPLLGIGRFVDAGVLTRIYFAGTPDRWATALASSTADISDVRSALVVDLVFAVSFGVVGFALMRVGVRWWAPDRRRRFGWWHLAPYAAIAAASLDVIETSGQLVWLEVEPPSWATASIAAIAWWKWAAYVAAVVGLLGLVVGPALAPLIRRVARTGFAPIDHQLGETATPPEHSTPEGATESVGICASGGGIRSASVMLGAFRGLSADGTFQRARWLHAVSGGGYAAGGWQVSSLEREEADLFPDDHPWFASVRHRRRFLDNGAGSLVGGVLGAAARTMAVFGGVLAAAVLVGWGVGWLVRSWALHPGFSNVEGGGATTWSQLTEWRLLLPGLIPVAAAVVALVIGRAQSAESVRRRIDRAAVALAASGAVLLVLLVAAPIGVRYGRPVLAGLVGQTAEANAGVLGLLSALGLVTAVRQLLTAEFKKRWSRLGGVALGFGLFLLAGKVADDQANLDRIFASPWVPVAALAWLVLLDIPPSHRLTLNGVYRKRLATTFCLGRSDDDAVPLPPVRFEDEPPWSAYRRTAGPELVLCGTSHASRRQFGGLRSLGFTFRPGGVTMHDGVSAPWRSYPSGSWWDGYPRRWVVSRSMALAGAAVASAMGRQSFGTTNTLLASVNLRLGMWVPNPRFPEWFVDRNTSPRVHLGYFVKELFNRYHPERDAFVYVADGGHRENLGLVEQLREQPELSIVLDASGDRPGTFSTLRQAVQLAGVELGAEVDIDFATVEHRTDDEPLDCVATGDVTYADGTTGRIVYAKAQLSDSAPIALRQFGAANPPFPDYSTGDQFLTEDEFDMLVALGEHLAARVAVAIAG